MSGSKNDLGFAAVRSCPLPPRYCGVAPRSPLFSGLHPAPLLPQQKLRRFICYFYETIKVTKSVFKRKGPLENLLWGTPQCHCGVIPAVTFGHAPPFALRVVSSSARGNVPFRALWGKSTPQSGDVPPSGLCKGCPLAYAFADFSRIRKVSAGVGCIIPQKEGHGESSPQQAPLFKGSCRPQGRLRGMGNPPHKKTSPHLTVWAGLSLDCLSNNQTTLS